MADIIYNLVDYEEKWVALSEPEGQVVGVGQDANEANSDAQKNGYQEALILKVPSSKYGYVPVA